MTHTIEYCRLILRNGTVRLIFGACLCLNMPTDLLLRSRIENSQHFNHVIRLMHSILCSIVRISPFFELLCFSFTGYAIQHLYEELFCVQSHDKSQNDSVQLAQLH